MTIGEWILVGLLSLCIIGVSIAIGLAVEGKASLVFTVVVACVLMITFAGMQFYRHVSYQGNELCSKHGCCLTEDNSPCSFCSEKEREEK